MLLYFVVAALMCFIYFYITGNNEREQYMKQHENKNKNVSPPPDFSARPSVVFADMFA